MEAGAVCLCRVGTLENIEEARIERKTNGRLRLVRRGSLGRVAPP